MIQDHWECEYCGLKLANVLLPVRHNCKPRGIGDTIAKMIASVGLKPTKDCGCKKRQAKLNQWFPYR